MKPSKFPRLYIYCIGKPVAVKCLRKIVYITYPIAFQDHFNVTWFQRPSEACEKSVFVNNNVTIHLSCPFCFYKISSICSCYLVEILLFSFRRIYDLEILIFINLPYDFFWVLGTWPIQLPSVPLGIQYTLLSTPVVSAATSSRPFCRGSFGIFAV